MAGNSVDVEDESVAALLELDTYYDEAYKFRTDRYNLPVNIKDPDLSESETGPAFDDIRKDFNRLTDALYRKEDISSLVDVDMLARYLMVNDLIVNYEIQHPKSTYVYKADLTDEAGKYVFGPVWDLDWAFGYETNKNYCTVDQKVDFWTAKSNKMEAWTFIRDLRQNTGEVVDKAYYKVWTDFMDNHLSGNMSSWINTRARHIYSKLTPYDLTEPDDPGTDGIVNVSRHGGEASCVDVYSLSGILMLRDVPITKLRGSLPKGI